MRHGIQRQLKDLRRHPVPPAALQAGRERLLMVMTDAPMEGMPNFFSARVTLWKPVLALLVVVVVTASGGGVVLASQGAVPGERLYAVKIAVEQARERAALSSEKKFAVQAEHASRRLQETEEVMKRENLLRDDRVERVQEAMRGYEEHLFLMDEIALTMDADRQQRNRQEATMHDAERVLDRHLALVASATFAEPIVAEVLLEPMEDVLDLQTDVFESLTERQENDGKEEDRQNFEKRHRARAEDVERSLRTLRREPQEPLRTR